jgi:hypothetical protein
MKNDNNSTKIIFLRKLLFLRNLNHICTCPNGTGRSVVSHWFIYEHASVIWGDGGGQAGGVLAIPILF